MDNPPLHEPYKGQSFRWGAHTREVLDGYARSQGMALGTFIRLVLETIARDVTAGQEVDNGE